MKKFLSVALIIMTILLAGCGNEKTAEQSASVEVKNEQPVPEVKKIDSILVAGSFWVLNSENMPYLSDALTRSDADYLKQLILEEKIFRVDRDTKVIQSGENNTQISFKEGRYTNKIGYSFTYNIFPEKGYPDTYLKSQEQEPMVLIHHGLAGTDNYFELIETDNIEALNQMITLCETIGRKIRENAEGTQINSSTRECMIRARELILYRGAAIHAHLEYKKNISQWEDNSPKHKREREDALRVTYELCKDVERLRQAFRNKYGY